MPGSSVAVVRTPVETATGKVVETTFQSASGGDVELAIAQAIAKADGSTASVRFFAGTHSMDSTYELVGDLNISGDGPLTVLNGNFVVGSGEILTLSDITITRSSADEVIEVASGGTLNMYNCTINGGSETSTPAILVAGSAEMSRCVITQTGAATAIHVNAGTLTVTDWLRVDGNDVGTAIDVEGTGSISGGAAAFTLKGNLEFTGDGSDTSKTFMGHVSVEQGASATLGALDVTGTTNRDIHIATLTGYARAAVGGVSTLVETNGATNLLDASVDVDLNIGRLAQHHPHTGSSGWNTAYDATAPLLSVVEAEEIHP